MTRRNRTAEFADAALRIIERDGLSALSFRMVASESGWSLGAVQKAFASKEAMLGAALECAQSRVSARASAEPAQPDLRRWLIALVMATLPLDDERRAAVVVGIAFSDRAAFDQAIATSVREQGAAIRGQLARLFAWRRSEGELAARLDDDAISRAVLAFAAGLAGELLYDPQSEAQVERLVTVTIDALLSA